jgi:hypothetical protein
MRRFALAFALAVLALPSSVEASPPEATEAPEPETATIVGVVFMAATGEPMDTTIVLAPVVTGEPWTDVFEHAQAHTQSNARGVFRFKGLAPGEYFIGTVGGSTPERITLAPGERLHLEILDHSINVHYYGPGPIDTSSQANSTGSLAGVLHRNNPTGGSDAITGTLALAPTALLAPGGPYLLGRDTTHNRYRLDGHDIGDPITGGVAMPITQEFLMGARVVESGYDARLGFASGGQLEAHVDGSGHPVGIVGLRLTPRLAPARLADSTDEALRSTQVQDFAASTYAFIAAHILPDRVRNHRLYFSLGLELTGVQSTLKQSFRHRVDGAFAQQSQRLGALRASWIGELTWHPARRHWLEFVTLGGPSFTRTAFRAPFVRSPFGGDPSIEPSVSEARGAFGIIDDHLGTNLHNNTMVGLRYQRDGFYDAVRIDAHLDYFQTRSEAPWRVDNPEILRRPAVQELSSRGQNLPDVLARQGMLAAVPGVSEACADDGAGVPCPIYTWVGGGLGRLTSDRGRRLAGGINLDGFWQAAGVHETSGGVEVRWNQRATRLAYSGSNDRDFVDGSCEANEQGFGEWCYSEQGGYRDVSEYRVDNHRYISINRDEPQSSVTHSYGRIRRETGELRAITDESGDGLRASAYSGAVSSLDYAGYLQDRWSLLETVDLTAGVRWELQDLRDALGHRATLIWDNVAPRVGASYDWTGEGKSRFYFHYGWYFQPIPLQLLSRSFGGIVDITRRFDPGACGEIIDEWCVDAGGTTSNTSEPTRPSQLRGAHERQWQFGYEHLLVDDVIIDLRWVHQDLGRAVVAVIDAGQLALANPANAKRTLDTYTLRLRTHLRKLELRASYSFTRLVGNHEGLGFQPEGELAVNSFGPLPGAARHAVNLDALLRIDIREAGQLTLGTSVRLHSGNPVDLRADTANPTYRGQWLTHLLPRGAGGRTPFNHRINFTIGYTHNLPRNLQLELLVRIINVTNAQTVLRVDPIYTLDSARPIAGGDSTELKHARRSGPAYDEYFGRVLVRPHPSYRAATHFQAPLSGQFELALRF